MSEPTKDEIKAAWKEHRGPNLTDTSHRLHCFEAGFRRGQAAERQVRGMRLASGLRLRPEARNRSEVRTMTAPQPVEQGKGHEHGPCEHVCCCCSATEQERITDEQMGLRLAAEKRLASLGHPPVEQR